MTTFCAKNHFRRQDPSYICAPKSSLSRQKASVHFGGNDSIKWFFVCLGTMTLLPLADGLKMFIQLLINSFARWLLAGTFFSRHQHCSKIYFVNKSSWTGLEPWLSWLSIVKAHWKDPFVASELAVCQLLLLTICAAKFNCICMRNCLGRDLWSSGFGRRLMFQRSWVRILAHLLDGHFSHLFVVKIVMCVWKDENKWKRGRGGPI